MASKAACTICAESAVGPDHNATPKHMKNLTLREYASNKNAFSANKNGIKISCSVSSPHTSIDSCSDAKINISAKPAEIVRFTFSVINQSKNENVLVVGVEIANRKLGFQMNNHGIVFGGPPVLLKKEQTLKPVEITYKVGEVGQYNMPVIFFFQKRNGGNFVIIRELHVYSELQPEVHSKEVTPYKELRVQADSLVRSQAFAGRCNKFCIPNKTYKKVFGCALSDKHLKDPAEINIFKKIKDTLELGVTERNYANYFHNLLWYEETIVRISLKKYNMSRVPLLASANFTYRLSIPGLAEKRPSVLIGDIVFVKPSKNPNVMFEGIVKTIDENVAHIGDFDDRFHEYGQDKGSSFDIRFSLSRRPLERMHVAIQGIHQLPNKWHVLPKKIKSSSPPLMKQFFNTRISANPEQRLAVSAAVAGAGAGAPFLLNGPPGTGKTTVVVEIALQLLKKSASNRILICTSSNMAADTVAVMLSKYHDQFQDLPNFMLRANSLYREWSSMPKELDIYSNGTDIISFKNVTTKLFDSYRIVVCTLSHSAKFARNEGPAPITHLIIDEASQASEPETVIPINALLAKKGALILAGDPMQLGPVVISHSAAKEGLGISLMERLITTCPLYNGERDPWYSVMLKHNFRSDDDILLLPNKLFYNNELKAFAPLDPLSRVDILDKGKKSRGIIFHGVLSKEQTMGHTPSFYNMMELHYIQQYVKSLIMKHHVREEDIGVITPYKRQATKVRKWLSNEKYGDNIEVGTVEAFQGKEKRVIIISTVRANNALLAVDSKFKLGFLVDDKRFNVAVTRGKAKVIVIGNPRCLANDVKWCQYMLQCREFGTYLGFDADNTLDSQVMTEVVERVKGLNLFIKTEDKEKKENGSGDATYIRN